MNVWTVLAYGYSERKFELTNQDSARRREKLDCPDVDESQRERH